MSSDDAAFPRIDPGEFISSFAEDVPDLPAHVAGPPLTYGELADLVRDSAPRRMVRWLRCHPSVWDALRANVQPDEMRGTLLGSVSTLLRVDVETRDDMAPGAWELLDRDLVVIESGVLGQ